MKVMMIWDYYPRYLNYFYNKHPEVSTYSFEAHRRSLLSDHFGWPGDLSQELNNNGIKTEFIVANYEQLQKRYYIENREKFKGQSDDLEGIVINQIKNFNPDIILLPNLGKMIRKLIDNTRGYYSKIFLYIGQKLPDKSILDESDHILTGVAERIVKEYNYPNKITSIEPGFNREILNKINRRDKKYDVVFAGNFTPDHTKRAEYIAYLLKNGIKVKVFAEKPGLGLRYFHNKIINRIKKQSATNLINLLNDIKLSFNYIRNAIKIRKNISQAVYGMDYYEVLAQSYICLNIHIDMVGNNYGGNMRMFETTGIGSCLITDYTQNLNTLFRIDRDVFAYESKKELLELIKYLLSNKELLNDTSKRGQERTLGCYSIYSMANKIIKLFKSELKI